MSKKNVTGGTSATSVETLKYRDLILQTDDQIAIEQLNNSIEQAEISFKQGILAMESKISDSKQKVFGAQRELKAAEANMLVAKRSSATTLVNAIINAKVNITQAQENLKAAEIAHMNLEEMHSFLLTTQKELF